MTDLSFQVTIDCDTLNQGGTVPVLAQCCDETCQTVSISGPWEWVDQGDYTIGGTSSIVLLLGDGSPFWFDFSAYSFNGDPPDCGDSLRFNGPYVVGNTNCWWETGHSTTYPDCLDIQPGALYELKVSWCLDCAAGLTVTFGIQGEAPLRSATVMDTCNLLDGAATFNVARAGIWIPNACGGPPVSSITGFQMVCGALPDSQNIPLWGMQCNA